MAMTNKAKILVFDIEVSRDVVEGYGPKHEFRVVKTLRHQKLMCFAYKWLGEKKVHYVSRNHVGGEQEMLQHLWNILDDADIVIGHNSNGFDNKMANRFFIEAGLPPTSPYKSIDTYRTARGIGKFQSYSLNALCEFLNIGTKSKITYADIETDFMNNPTPKIERLMEKYNKQDVVLTEKLYLKLRPYIKNHPNLCDLMRLHGACPKCGSTKLQKRGFNKAAAGDKQRYQCQSCGGWCSEANIKKVGRTVNA